MEKVSNLYDTKFQEYSRRTDRIKHVLGCANGVINVQEDTTDELDEVLSIFLELRMVFRNLKWFGELNHKGFVEILKKLDKKLAYVAKLANEQLQDSSSERTVPTVGLPCNNREAYLTTRIEALPFANATELLDELATINNMLNQLGDEQTHQQLWSNEVARTTSELNILRIGRNHKYFFDKDSMHVHYELIGQNDATRLMADLCAEPTSGPAFDQPISQDFLSNYSHDHSVTAQLIAPLSAPPLKLYLLLPIKATLCNTDVSPTSRSLRHQRPQLFPTAPSVVQQKNKSRMNRPLSSLVSQENSTGCTVTRADPTASSSRECAPKGSYACSANWSVRPRCRRS